MKKIFVAILAISALAVAATSCKPTEKNYKDAYEKAMSRRDNSAGIDSTIYARIRQEAQPSQYVVGSDTMPMVTQRATLAPDQDYAQFRRYNIVVGEFKQIFNARSMQQRLYAAGYPNPFILQTREPQYLVVAVSCSTPAEAMKMWRKAADEPPFTLRDPFPYVLQVSQLVR